MTPRGRIAFLLSGSGSTLANLLARIDAGEVPGDVVVAISDKPGAKGLDHARARGIPVAVVNRKSYATSEAFSRGLDDVLRAHAPDLVACGGFLSIFRVPPDLRGRVLNVHPSLLPAFGGKGFYGDRVHRAVLDRGVKVTGCSVHFVNEDVDGGPIVDQAVVRVEDDDTPETLAHRVQEAERELFPRCIRLFLEDRLEVVQGRVRVKPERP